MAAPTSVPSEDTDNDFGSVFFKMEKLIMDEMHSDLTQDMKPEDISFVMMSEKLLLLEEYKEFVKMTNSGTSRQKLNEFLLECLERAVRGRDGLLNRLHQILSSTDRKQLADTVKTKMADYSIRSELESKWKIEWKNMKRKIKKMEQEIVQLRSLNQHMIEAIHRFRADCDICVYHPSKPTHWMHPESEQSRSEMSDSSSNTSEVESNASDMTITSLGDDHFDSSMATIIPNFDNLSIQLGSANSNVVNKMAVLWPQPFLNLYSSTTSLVSSASEKSATESENSKWESDKTNSGSTGSLSTGTNKTKINAGVKKLPDHPNDTTTSARTDLSEYKEPEIKDPTATQIDIATLSVEPMKSLVDSSIDIDIGNAKDNDNATADQKHEQTQSQAILVQSITKETNRQKRSSNDFYVIMKNRRELIDSGKVCPDLQSRLEPPDRP